MTRREFITLLGVAAAWPLAAQGQQPERMRRIGVLTGDAEDDPGVKARLAAFREGLDRLGWSLDRNVPIDYRFGANNPTQYQPLAKELVRLQPDVLLAYTTPVAAAFEREFSSRSATDKPPDLKMLLHAKQGVAFYSTATEMLSGSVDRGSP